VEASGEHEAQDALRGRGVFVTRLTAMEGGGGSGGAVGGSARSRELPHFLRQFSVLVGTGTPVVEALGALERQTAEGAWRDVLSDVRKRVEEGSQLSEAMQAHPRVFDGVVRSLIAAGEAGGRLGDMLEELAVLVRQQQKIRSNLLGALVYPSLLVAISVGVMGVMLGFVLPRFEVIFQTLDTPLPATTRLLMDLSVVVREQWMWMVGIAAGAIGGGAVWLRTEGGRRALDTAMVHLPTVGGIVRGLATARICRVLGVLLEGRVAMLDALKLARDSAGNSLYREVVERAERHVTRGEPVSSALRESGLVSDTVCEAVRSGERTGRLGAVLTAVADYLDEDNEVVVRTLTSILEPVILLTLGLIVAFMAVSMFLPLFDLTAAAKGGG
jgi:type II secretory pathway component PulF